MNPALTADEAATHQRSAMVIWAALLLGPLVLAVVVRGLVENQNAIATEGAPLDPILSLLVWAVVAASALAGAFIFRARAAGLADTAETRDEMARGQGPSPATLITNLVVAWALAEGQLLLALALYFMSGSLLLWWSALILHVAALAGAFPQKSWFTGLVPGASGE